MKILLPSRIYLKNQPYPNKWFSLPVFTKNAFKRSNSNHAFSTFFSIHFKHQEDYDDDYDDCGQYFRVHLSRHSYPYYPLMQVSIFLSLLFEP